MNIPLLTPELIEAFIIVFIRVSAMILMVPIFGERRVPFMVTWGLSLLISSLLFPLVEKQAAPAVDLDFLSFALRIGGELAIGVIIGFAARFIFAGIQVAGELIGVQIGFSIANVIDPASNQQVSLITEIQYMLALLLFLTVDAHHIFIAAIAESYERIHRSNLIGMGVAPLQFKAGESLQSLGLTGFETYEITGISDGLALRKDLTVKARSDDGKTKEFKVTCRIETPAELDYYRHGGILEYVLRQLA